MKVRIKFKTHNAINTKKATEALGRQSQTKR